MSSKWMRVATASWLALLLNVAYIAAFPSPTLFYMGNVVLHLLLGLVLVAAVLVVRRQFAEQGLLGSAGRWAVMAIVLSGLAGTALAVVGNTTPHRWLLWTHVGMAAVAALSALVWLAQRAASGGRFPLVWRASLSLALLAVLVPAAVWFYRSRHPDLAMRIRNPEVVPASMDEEGGGPKSPFFPSSAKTNVGGIIPSNFFMESETCGECHQDIYRQWKSSAHHFASFNNQ